MAARFLDEASIELVPVDQRQADAVITAYRRFGKGRHAAALNYGDCFTYALALAESAPVLCTGADFGQTDIAVVSSRAAGADPSS